MSVNLNDIQEKLYEEAWDFVEAMQQSGLFKPEFQRSVWLSNFAPPFFVSYLHYVMHYYNEITSNDIAVMCDAFGEQCIPEGNPDRAGIIANMKGFIRQMPSSIQTFRSLGADYETAFCMLMYGMFGMEVDPDGATKIGTIVNGICGYRNKMEPGVEKNIKVFANFAKGYATALKDECGNSRVNSGTADAYLSALALYCAKYFARHLVPAEWAPKYRMQRDYITQEFIKRVMVLLSPDQSFRTNCYSMWNHLVKKVNPDERSAMATAVMLVFSNIIELNENNFSVVQRIYGKTLDYQKSVEFRFGN